jgi:hypothetical protein
MSVNIAPTDCGHHFDEALPGVLFQAIGLIRLNRSATSGHESITCAFR